MRTHSLSVSAWTVLESLLTPPNALVIETMLQTGLRVSDVLSLRTEQLRSGQRFTVEESKTGKHKRVYICKALYTRLLAQSGEVYIFEGSRSAYVHRTRQAVWHDVKRASKAMRIDICIGTHSARKSYAVGEYERTGDLLDVQLKLNHDDLATTILYLLDEFEKKKPPL